MLYRSLTCKHESQILLGYAQLQALGAFVNVLSIKAMPFNH